MVELSSGLQAVSRRTEQRKIFFIRPSYSAKLEIKSSIIAFVSIIIVLARIIFLSSEA